MGVSIQEITPTPPKWKGGGTKLFVELKGKGGRNLPPTPTIGETERNWGAFSSGKPKPERAPYKAFFQNGTNGTEQPR